MLRTLRKYRTSIFGFVAVAMIAVAMSGFGVNLAMTHKTNTYAIKVGDEEISFDEFYSYNRNLEAKYRQMFGKDYFRIIKNFNLDLKQQAVDTLIRNTLLRQFATKLGFSASDSEIRQFLQTQLFPTGFDSGRYQEFLREQGLSPQGFEDKIRDDVQREQLTNLLSDFMNPSKLEIQHMAERDLAKFSFKVASFSPDKFIDKVPAPADTEVTKWYEEHQTDYEIPVSVEYNYLVMKPEDVFKEVPVTEDDIEFEYSENKSRFMTPEELRFSHILLNYPDKASEDQKKAIAAKAKDILEKAKSGDAFDQLAKTYSQDSASAIMGGDIGWVSKGKRGAAFDTAAFKLKVGEISDAVESAKGLEIIKCEERKEPKQKELSEVHADIEKMIRDREAPGILAAKAHELFDSFEKGQVTLADFAKTNNLSQTAAYGPAKIPQNPAGLKGVTEEFVNSPGEQKALVESDTNFVFAELKSFHDASIAKLEDVKAPIVKKLKEAAAKALADKEAHAVLSALQANAALDLDAAVKEKGITAEVVSETTEQMAKPPLTDEKVKSKVFSFSTSPQAPQEVFDVKGVPTLVSLTAIKQPTAEEIAEKVKTSSQGIQKELADLLIESLVNKLKSETVIDIQPSILTSSNAGFPDDSPPDDS